MGNADTTCNSFDSKPACPNGGLFLCILILVMIHRPQTIDTWGSQFVASPSNLSLLSFRFLNVSDVIIWLGIDAVNNGL